MELEPRFVRREVRIEPRRFLKPGIDPMRGNWTEADTEERVGPVEYQVEVDTIQEAQGVRFLCPVCFETNNGPVGTHGVICWSRSRGIPDGVQPGPGRWLLVGTGLADLTLNGDGGSRSVALTGDGGCKAHFHVTNGEVHP